MEKLAAALAVLLAASWSAGQTPARTHKGAPPAAAVTAIDAAHLMQPQELVRLLQASRGEKPLVLQVGSRVLFAQAHTPGSEYMGAGSSDAGRQQLRERLKPLARGRLIVLYCGCCPWRVCPNVLPAYQEARALGFTFADNFGAEWADKGYPTAKGER